MLSTYLSVSLSVRPSVCPSICPFIIYLSSSSMVYLIIYLIICLPVICVIYLYLCICMWISAKYIYLTLTFPWNFSYFPFPQVCLTRVSNLTCSEQQSWFFPPEVLPVAVHVESILPVAQVKTHGIILSLTPLFLSHSVSLLSSKLSAFPSKYVQDLPILSLPQLIPYSSYSRQG